MGLTEAETTVLAMCGNAELKGALFLGGMAIYHSEPELKNRLIWHCMEETRHSMEINKLVQSSEYLDKAKEAQKEKFPTFFNLRTKDLIEFLIMVQTFELRAPFQYTVMMGCTENEDIKKLLTRLNDDEIEHLSWVKEYLQKLQEKDPEKVKHLFNKLIKIDKEAHERDIEIYNKYWPEFASSLRNRMPEFENYAKTYLSQNFNI
jgi:hypothetical protein